LSHGVHPVVVTGLKSEAKILRGLGLACISVGGKARSAPGKIESVIAQGATGLVSFGIAGALHPDLRNGDVVVAQTVVDEAGAGTAAHSEWVRAFRLTTTPPSLPGLTRQSKSASAPGTQELGSPGLDAARRPGDDEVGGQGRIVVGAILGLDNLVSSPQDKAAAFARSEAWAIDMESHHVARAAAAHGLPFIAVRAISDQANETLPACLADCVDGEGRTKMSAVVAALIFGRVKLGELIAAGRASRRAHQALFGCRGALAGLR
jgi:nucleoside phosphorylase